MLPAFLITFREIVEVSLIVATILGILVKLNQRKSIKVVWLAAGLAFCVSILLLGLGSLFGLKAQALYSGKTEKFIEGLLMIVSAVFITWAVFFLHTYFSRYKVHLLKKIKKIVEQQEQKGLFILVFTAVLREGFEIVLFLTTIYFSSNPQSIFIGFIAGVAGGLLISLALFGATIKMPVHAAFKTTSILLILFSAGLLARGAHELAEAGLLPAMNTITLLFVPQTGTFAADMIKAIFGVTQKMDIVQLSLYAGYTFSMGWYVLLRKNQAP